MLLVVGSQLASVVRKLLSAVQLKLFGKVGDFLFELLVRLEWLINEPFSRVRTDWSS